MGLFIEETNRILTKQGLAVLELQEFRDDHPKEHKEMIEIWKNNKKINTLKYLKNFKNIKIKKSKGRDWHYIIMKKTKNLNIIYLVSDKYMYNSYARIGLLIQKNKKVNFGEVRYLIFDLSRRRNILNKLRIKHLEFIHYPEGVM